MIFLDETKDFTLNEMNEAGMRLMGSVSTKINETKVGNYLITFLITSDK